PKAFVKRTEAIHQVWRNTNKSQMPQNKTPKNNNTTQNPKKRPKKNTKKNLSCFGRGGWGGLRWAFGSIWRIR
ncbi:hypothetical protein ACJBQ7_10460, partial [Streptococcus suis]